MYTRQDQEYIKILVADDDEDVLECYREAFGEKELTDQVRALEELAAELFNPEMDIENQPKFDMVVCNQGDDAVKVAAAARQDGEPFDVVILDVRMPPGIDGIEAGSQIRKLDPDVEIVFISGHTDVPFEELQRRVPPPLRLHYFNKPLSFIQLAEDVVTMVRTH
ncbi:MAG: response regulator [Proteobacteria bacterium]|nr:response regulator [Pseudomonadota bacterium]